MIITVNDKAVMEQKVARSIYQIYEIVEDPRAQYASQTFDKVTVPVSNSIRRHEILTFGNRSDLTKKETNRVVYRRLIII